MIQNDCAREIPLCYNIFWLNKRSINIHLNKAFCILLFGWRLGEHFWHNYVFKTGKVQLSTSQLHWFLIPDSLQLFQVGFELLSRLSLSQSTATPRDLSKWTFIRQWPSNNNLFFFSHKKKLAASITRGRRERTIRIATIRILICRFIQINSIRALGYVHAPVALLRNHVYRIIIFRGIYLLAMLIMFRCASVCWLVCKLMGKEHSLITKQRRARSIWNAFFPVAFALITMNIHVCGVGKFYHDVNNGLFAWIVFGAGLASYLFDSLITQRNMSSRDNVFLVKASLSHRSLRNETCDKCANESDEDAEN